MDNRQQPNQQPEPGDQTKQPGIRKVVQEATDFLASILATNPLPEPPESDPVTQEHEGVYAVGSEAAKHLNCVAIVRGGKIIPIVELEGAPEPKTPGEKMYSFALTARTILDGLMEALLFWEERRRMERGESDEGDGSHV